MEILDRLTETTARWMAIVAGGLVVIIAVMISVDVIARAVFGTVALHSYEYGSYLFAISLAFGLSYVGLSGAHIRLDVVYAWLPLKMRRICDIASLASLSFLSCFMFYLAFELMLKNSAKGVVSTSYLAIPLKFPQAVWVVGLFVFALTSLLLSVRHMGYLLAGNGLAADGIGAINPEKEIVEAIEDAAAEGGRS